MSKKNRKSNKKVVIISILLILAVIAGVMYIGRDFLFNSDTDIAEYNTNNEQNIINKTNNENTIAEPISEETELPVIEENTELFGKYYEKAEELLNDMSLEEKVGQMFLVRFPESGVINEIKNYYPGRIYYVW